MYTKAAKYLEVLHVDLLDKIQLAVAASRRGIPCLLGS